jgi:alkanesulfonate monooxygenase SsuD/methylene tetrahydromethanopterin reductase-like flavin-dependent oxidoreductase (luciferase family)
LEPIDRALSRKLTGAQLAARAKLDFRSDIVGGVETVASRLRELTETSGADEIMALSNIQDPRQRRNSLRRLATAAGLGDGSAT